ncbi:nucleotidyltransferase domain-containing protein [Conexibacter sp. JD483]|uniref:nucleotidyltransferase domain-containing protein n=1 Tax=unclassified Conexibacter TaxID=2627773 RepID=UPI0027190D45|nr:MULTISPECIES: nucleotidyltransferase domain-containing protein [unclassified Conexibacter]MDO8188394.1 nucleotidyltransferase domain-containing protein [Conexibacter sp. CPCC 205706]MDO8198181.1 nucleotidyltransferase domain-containing protein [Conexibacter sp. CPCC 205762]MDR9370683.1 nucleotidyltransferase domain-containing protein [Conexibacter sp. JD483]
MDLSRPYSAVVPSLDGDVLAALAGTSQPLSGREVARRARRGSQRGVLTVLDRLVEQGLVRRQEAGGALLFTLNRDHVAAGAVAALAELRVELLRRIRDEIGGWAIAPRFAAVFGSFARADGGTESDIDLLVVRSRATRAGEPGWQAQLDGLSESIARWSGNHAGLVELSEQELPRLRKQRPPVVAELLRDAVVVHGPPVTAILGEEA